MHILRNAQSRGAAGHFFTGLLIQEERGISNEPSCKKSVFRVTNQSRQKPACAAAEARKKHEISNSKNRKITLYDLGSANQKH